MPTQEEQRIIVQQNEVRLILNAIEATKNETLGRVVSAVVAEFQLLEDGVMTRYGMIPTADQTPTPLVATPLVVPTPTPTIQPTPTPVPTRAPVVVPAPSPVLAPVEETMEDPTKVQTVVAQPTQPKGSGIPENLTNRLSGLNWYKTSGADYKLRNMDMFDPDIKAFWLSVLGDKKESERFSFESFVYQVAIGKENSVWLRRWGPVSDSKGAVQ